MKYAPLTKKGTKALLNFSGIELEGTLDYFNSERFTFIFKIIDPFTKVERLQSFTRADIIKSL